MRKIQNWMSQKKGFADTLKLKRPVFKLDTSKTYLGYNWNQTKRRFPGVNPQGDLDLDGTRNKFDCKPFDPARDGLFARLLGRQTKEEYQKEKQEKSERRYERKMEKRIKKEQRTKSRAMEKEVYKEMKTKKKVERNVRGRVWEERREKLRQFAKKKGKKLRQLERKSLAGRLLRSRFVKVKKAKKGGGLTYSVGGVTYKVARKGYEGTARSSKGPGRPRMTFKYKDPRTGKPIPAVQYYRIRKELKRGAQAVETQTEVQQRFALARRGLSPEEVEKARQLTEYRRALAMAQLQQAQIQTQPVSSQITTQPIQGQVQPPMQRFRVVTDIMTGRKRLEPLPQSDRWTQNRDRWYGQRGLLLRRRR